MYLVWLESTCNHIYIYIYIYIRQSHTAPQNGVKMILRMKELKQAGAFQTKMNF